MAFSSIQEFSDFLRSLIQLVIKKGDEKPAELQAQLDKLSADLAEAHQKIEELTIALSNSDAVLAEQLAAQAKEQLTALDDLSTQLAAEFNPTPTADAVSEAVKELEDVETPVEVTESTDIGTGTPTDPQVAEAAIDAIIEAVPDI